MTIDDVLVCTRCNKPWRGSAHAKRNCRVPETVLPSGVAPPNLQPAAEKLGIRPQDIANYASALTRWTLEGFPTRTPEEVAGIYATHCEPCPEHVGGRCRACGCCVRSQGLAVRNKLAMKTEICPKGKWK